MVGLGGAGYVGVGAEEGEAADLPAGVKLLERLLHLDVEHRALVPVETGAERALLAFVLLAELAVVGFDLGLLGRVEGVIASRYGVLRGALEHGEVLGGLGDDRNGLDPRGAGADHANPLAGEIDALFGVAAGVAQLALEGVDALDVGDIGRRQTAHRGYEVLGGNQIGVGTGGSVVVVDVVYRGSAADVPAAGVVVEGRLGDLGVELDVPIQVVALGHVLGVAEDLGLARISLGPLPLLLQFGIEAVAVLQALHIAAGAGIAVPVPGAAHIVAGLVGLGGQPHLAELVQHVDAGEAGADYHGVVVDRAFVVGAHGCFSCGFGLGLNAGDQAAGRSL